MKKRLFAGNRQKYYLGFTGLFVVDLCIALLAIPAMAYLLHRRDKPQDL